MYLVAIAWMYVVLMMVVVEAQSRQGTLLGAFITLVLYGLLPLSIVLYVMGSPARRRARQRAEADEQPPVARQQARLAPPGAAEDISTPAQTAPTETTPAQATPAQKA